MKQLFTLCLLLVVATGIHAQQWYQMAIPHARNVNDVVLKSKTDIQIAGGFFINDSMESMFRSTSEGMVWDFLGDYPGHAWIESFAFNTPVTATAVGTHGKIKRTIDGGLNWFYSSAPIDRDLSKIVFTDNVTGYVVGRKDFDSIQTIWKTTDGGQTFSVLLDQPGERLNSVAFVSNSSGFAVGDKGTILATANSGLNWTPVSAPLQRNFKSIYFADALNGFIVGGDDSTRTILQTTNAGANWTVLKDETGACLNDVWFLTPGKGFIAGDNSVLLRSLDGGLSWNQDTVVNSFTQKFTAVRFLTDSFGFIAAHGGSCFIYTKSVAPDAYVLNAMVIDSTSATVINSINTHGYPGNYQIISATDSLFSNNISFTYPQPILTYDTANLVPVTLTGLLPDSNYYYRVLASTLAGYSMSGIGHFYTGATTRVFKTMGATGITANAAQLNGLVNHLQETVTLSFEYGATPAMGNVLAASPATVSDSLQHNLTASVNGLQTHTTYYYRLKGVGTTNLYYGDIGTFFTGTPYVSFQANAVTNITDSSATFNAYIDRCYAPVSLAFEYDTSAALSKVVIPFPNTISDTGQYVITASVSGLKGLKQYQVRLKGQTAFGDLYSNTVTFYTGATFNVFKTLAATNVTSSGAQLHGLAGGLNGSANLSFEFGTTTAFGTQVAASPATISDTATHQLSATITGLLPNAVYYVRMKGTVGAVDFYADTIQLYTGASGIPNWDFQVWENNTVELPTGWNLFNENFAKLNGHSGNALQVVWPNVAMMGFVGDKATGGQAFSYRPDSVSFFLNYNMQTIDTGLVLVQLLQGSTPVSENVFFIGGNSGGSFKRFSAAVAYNSGAMPDSLMIGVIPANPFTNTLPVNTGNYIAIDDISFGSGAPAVLNGNMEDWFNYNYERLPGWYYPKFLNAEPGVTPTVSKTWFAQPDDYAVLLSNITDGAGNMHAAGIENLDKVLGQGGLGFPCVIQHQTLNGYYKFLPQQNDTLEISISFSRAGQNIGYGSLFITDSATDFMPFEIPLVFNDNVVQPDTADILIRIGTQYSPKGLSVAAIDKLSFDGFTGLPKGMKENAGALLVSPNPATSDITLSFNVFKPGSIDYRIYDSKGALVISEQGSIAKPGVAFRTLQVSSLPQGSYIAKVAVAGKESSARFVVVH